jgi:DNA-binding transcriptional MerR regulator
LIKRFSIGELEQFSEIKAHTIRIWERRHKIFTPQRSAGLTRSYGLEEVKLLLNIALLNRNGSKISDLAPLHADAIAHKVNALTTAGNREMQAVNKLICTMFGLEVYEFEEVLDECISTVGIDATIKKVILPFLEKVDILSYSDTSNEVHFAVTSTRRKIILGIERLQTPVKQSKSVLLFLPEKEHYDLVLLYMTYLIKMVGYKTFYLGTNISAENLEKAIIKMRPDILCTYFTTTNQKDKTEQVLKQMHNHVPLSKLYVASRPELTNPQTAFSNVAFINYHDCSNLALM